MLASGKAKGGLSTKPLLASEHIFLNSNFFVLSISKLKGFISDKILLYWVICLFPHILNWLNEWMLPHMMFLMVCMTFVLTNENVAAYFILKFLFVCFAFVLTYVHVAAYIILKILLVCLTFVLTSIEIWKKEMIKYLKKYCHIDLTIIQTMNTQ